MGSTKGVCRGVVLVRAVMVVREVEEQVVAAKGETVAVVVVKVVEVEDRMMMRMNPKLITEEVRMEKLEQTDVVAEGVKVVREVGEEVVVVKVEGQRDVQVVLLEDPMMLRMSRKMIKEEVRMEKMVQADVVAEVVVTEGEKAVGEVVEQVEEVVAVAEVANEVMMKTKSIKRMEQSDMMKEVTKVKKVLRRLLAEFKERAMTNAKDRKSEYKRNITDSINELQDMRFKLDALLNLYMQYNSMAGNHL